MTTKIYPALVVCLVASFACSKQEEKPVAAEFQPNKSNKEKTNISEINLKILPADLTTSVGKPSVNINVHLNSGYITKEKVESILSRVHWQTYPEGKEIKFSYSWIQPHPYEEPQNTPKGQTVNNSKPTDITGNPINNGNTNSEQETTISIFPDSNVEERWYQVVFEDVEKSTTNFENINPRRSGRILSRFNLASTPTIQSIQLCKKSENKQKITVRFSEPVYYEQLKNNLMMAPLAVESTCSFIEQNITPSQTSLAEYLCTGLWGDTIAVKIKPNDKIKSASSENSVSLININAGSQQELFLAPPGIEVNFKTSYKENEYCYIWTP